MLVFSRTPVITNFHYVKEKNKLVIIGGFGRSYKSIVEFDSLHINGVKPYYFSKNYEKHGYYYHNTTSGSVDNFKIQPGYSCNVTVFVNGLSDSKVFEYKE